MREPESTPVCSPRDERAQSRAAKNEVDRLLKLPWRGQASKITGVRKKLLEQFEERGVRKQKFEEGVLVQYAVTKYWVKFDSEETSKETQSLNITRLFAELLKSKHCPGVCHKHVFRTRS